MFCTEKFIFGNIDWYKHVNFISAFLDNFFTVQSVSNINHSRKTWVSEGVIKAYSYGLVLC